MNISRGNMSVPLYQAKAEFCGEVLYSISVPEVCDLLLAARNILSGIIAIDRDLQAQLTPTVPA